MWPPSCLHFFFLLTWLSRKSRPENSVSAGPSALRLLRNRLGRDIRIPVLPKSLAFFPVCYCIAVTTLGRVRLSDFTWVHSEETVAWELYWVICNDRCPCLRECRAPSSRVTTDDVVRLPAPVARKRFSYYYRLDAGRPSKTFVTMNTQVRSDRCTVGNSLVWIEGKNVIRVDGRKLVYSFKRIITTMRLDASRTNIICLRIRTRYSYSIRLSKHTHRARVHVSPVTRNGSLYNYTYTHHVAVVVVITLMTSRDHFFVLVRRGRIFESCVRFSPRYSWRYRPPNRVL